MGGSNEEFVAGFVGKRICQGGGVEKIYIRGEEELEGREQYLPYLLRKLMADCTDFKNEKSAMAHLFDQLSTKGECRLILLVSPKYHCEIAGEGIEYVWGLIKKWFRAISMIDNKTKKKVEQEIMKCVSKVSKQHINRFAARCRRYMLAYTNQARLKRDAEPSLTYCGVEKFVKSFYNPQICALAK